MGGVMAWDELVKWQDGQVDIARQDMLERGRVLPKVVFLAPGAVSADLTHSGMKVISEAKADQSAPPEESVVIVVRDATPIGIAQLLQAASEDPEAMGLMWGLGQRQGWTEEKTAQEICRITRKEWGCSDDMDLHWLALKLFGNKLKAYACVNITEAYVGPQAERKPGQQVRDMPGRKEAVLLNLETAEHSRQVAFQILREVPADESSKVVGLSENAVMAAMEGRATGLIRRAS